MKWTLLLLAPLLLIGQAAIGQDTRQVREPAIPAACATLRAEIGRAGASIAFEDETKLDTARIQKALDGCGAGKAVVLERASGRLDAFLSGPLELRRGVALVVSGGAYLFASRNPRDYDLAPGVCGTIDKSGHGCRPLINGLNVEGAAVMGDGAIDGRGGETLLGQSVSWWNLSDEARAGGSQNVPRLLVLKGCDNFTMYRITLLNSPNFHVSYSGGDGFTVWGVKIRTPERARNTDGIDPGNSTNVTITNCFISTGDDHVAIKAGAGKPTTHMTISHNHFYAGHGMSIGSETNGGASAIRVTDLSIDGADNGLRIKSNSTRGGLVRDVEYQDVCIRDTVNPIYLDTNYLAHASDTAGLIPVFRDIAFRDIEVEGAGKVTLEGLDAGHKLGVTFENVWFADLAKTKVSVKNADLFMGSNLQPMAGNVGENVTTMIHSAGQPKTGCAAKFVAFPERPR